MTQSNISEVEEDQVRPQDMLRDETNGHDKVVA